VDFSEHPVEGLATEEKTSSNPVLIRPSHPSNFDVFSHHGAPKRERYSIDEMNAFTISAC